MAKAKVAPEPKERCRKTSVVSSDLGQRPNKVAFERARTRSGHANEKDHETLELELGKRVR
jgi:hypothetical protein